MQEPFVFNLVFKTFTLQVHRPNRESNITDLKVLCKGDYLFEYW